MRVEDLDKNLHYEKCNRNGKTIIIINVLLLERYRWRSCLQNVSYVFPENDGFQLWQFTHMFMHGGICTSFQYVCFVFFWSALRVLGSKVLFFYILWFRRRIDAYRN
jgi:hypothetical protein